MESKRSIMLVDCQSFYASVEKSAHPELCNKPVAVGDPARKSGIVLAACPIAKSYGVSTAMRNFEALAVCPDLTIVRPRMKTYIDVSTLITEIYESFTDLVEPWSIDEQFIDVTGSTALFGSPEKIARQMQTKVMLSTGVWIRAGISSTKILAKMATDNFAKKSDSGIFELPADQAESILWPLPISRMYMVGSRMTVHFVKMGLNTIGDIARLELGEFKRRMRIRMGRQSDIKAEYYWQTARGIDPSPVVARAFAKPQSITRGRTVQSTKYQTMEDIEPLMIELVIEVCRTSRRYNSMGRVVTVSVGTMTGGFSRQMTIPSPTCLEHHVVSVARELFKKYWNGDPLTHLAVDLSQLTNDSTYQLDLFEDIERNLRLAKAQDNIKDRFGGAAIIRASSLLGTAQAKERAIMIGGHYA
ncbi:DNA polymerase IV [Paenibacillus ferrarius]|uniref:DNA polymerase IV n=1 Tax=Paenibacillus ferrarius TaxID=1469647 RepID=A0A1V4HER6_9BACL|nr:DNA polymerase IV [Paenibacillus ferrarius]OPH53004.1 DNA polymerase IV [Paenibacillus ferrarius]